MAQHRTKKEKIGAAIHRLENSQQYSLSSVNTPLTAQNIPFTQKSPSTPRSIGINMQTVKADLSRTAISLLVILFLLAVGYRFLR